ncbi:MAG: 50S ribosomal protein L3 [Dehalococcoidia bacterium]|nr:50S ribosomal protein L3 [Dehalococcoidia bacterium]
MINGIVGRKVGMTHLFQEDGRALGVTVIEAGPCTVTQVKTQEKDGYQAVQIGFGEAKKLNSPEKGHLKKNGAFKHLREFSPTEPADIKVGHKVDVSLFKVGDKVDLIGISKGKGFAGGVKRYHFRGGPKTHGQSDRHRAPGSVGATTTPGRVFKGLRMAGHMGDDRVTVKHVEVVRVDPDRNLLLVNGAAPGARNGLLLIKKTRG